jgi:hypothetical protein
MVCCALNAEFQHFILRSNKNDFTLPIPAERGDIGWKEAQTQGDKHNFGNKQLGHYWRKHIFGDRKPSDTCLEVRNPIWSNIILCCALNAEFQHFILSCSISYWDLIKTTLLYQYQLKQGILGWKEAQRQGDNRVTLWITLISVLLSTCHKSIMVVMNGKNNWRLWVNKNLYIIHGGSFHRSFHKVDPLRNFPK